MTFAGDILLSVCNVQKPSFNKSSAVNSSNQVYQYFRHSCLKSSSLKHSKAIFAGIGGTNDIYGAACKRKPGSERSSFTDGWPILLFVLC